MGVPVEFWMMIVTCLLLILIFVWMDHKNDKR
jgi:uncharacterized membrane protein (DUF106 family)